MRTPTAWALALLAARATARTTGPPGAGRRARASPRRRTSRQVEPPRTYAGRCRCRRRQLDARRLGRPRLHHPGQRPDAVAAEGAGRTSPGGASAGGHAVAEKRSVHVLRPRRRQAALAARHDLQGAGDHPPDQPVLLRLARHRRRARDRQPRVGRPGLLRLRRQGALAATTWASSSTCGATPRRRSSTATCASSGAAPASGSSSSRSTRRPGKKVWETPEPGGDAGITSKKFSARGARRSSPASATRTSSSSPCRSSSRATTRRRARSCGRPRGRAATATPRRCSSTASRSTAATLVKLGGTGDITKDQLRYRVGGMYISTAVVAGDYLYTSTTSACPACYEWKTGKELWKDQIEERPGGTARVGVAGPRRRPRLHHRPAAARRSSSPPGRSTSTSPRTGSNEHDQRLDRRRPAATSSSARTSTCGASARRSSRGAVFRATSGGTTRTVPTVWGTGCRSSLAACSTKPPSPSTDRTEVTREPHARRRRPRPRQGPPPESVPHDAAHPPVRGAAGPVAPARADPRRLPHLRRPGGDRRRRLRPPAARRRRLQHAPRPRPRPGQGRAAARADRRAVRPGDRLLARPRRQHAPVRARGRHDGHQRHRRPVHPAGRRRRLQLQAAEDRTASASRSSATARSTTAPSTRG